jgi:hypothetical protein
MAVVFGDPALDDGIEAMLADTVLHLYSDDVDPSDAVTLITDPAAVTLSSWDFTNNDGTASHAAADFTAPVAGFTAYGYVILTSGGAFVLGEKFAAAKTKTEGEIIRITFTEVSIS